MNRRDLLFALGRPLSPLYSLAMRLRSRLYRNNIFKSSTVDVPVVCVGNLTMGGTGKTPMVMYVVRALQNKAKRVVVVSRGYGGRAGGPVNVVSDGNDLLLSSSEAGDEPRLIAESLSGVPVLTGVHRALVAEEAVRLFSPDVIVLDDGFQHLALDRDVNIVLFSARSLSKKMRVFPGGELREPFEALGRAHAFVITGVGESNRLDVNRFKESLREKFSGIPVFTAEYKAMELVDANGWRHELKKWLPKKFYCFCGLAGPETFLKTLEEAQIQSAGFNAFPDHHRYSAADLRELADHARTSGAEALLTTEKDLVKLGSERFQPPLFALRVKLIPEDSFDDFLSTMI